MMSYKVHHCIKEPMFSTCFISRNKVFRPEKQSVSPDETLYTTYLNVIYQPQYDVKEYNIIICNLLFYICLHQI